MELPEIDNSEIFINSIIGNLTYEIEQAMSDIEQLTSEMTDIFNPGDFNGFYKYIDSLLANINTELDTLS